MSPMVSWHIESLETNGEFSVPIGHLKNSEAYIKKRFLNKNMFVLKGFLSF